MTSFFSALLGFFRRLFRPNNAISDRLPSASRSVVPVASEDAVRDRSAPSESTSALSLNGRPAASKPAVDAPTENGQAAVSDELRRLVYQATYAMPKPRMHAGQFGACLRRISPAFSYEKYGFTKLIYLLAAVPDIVHLERVNNPGAAPAYYVRPVLAIKLLLTQVMETFDSEDGWVHIDSVLSAIAQSAPTFSLHPYGFSTAQSFLETCTDLLEFKPDSPNYVRLGQPSQGGDNESLFSKRTANPKRLAVRPTVKPVAISNRIRPAIKLPEKRPGKTRSIVHLSKFAGFSPIVLNQKVSELAAIAHPERWYFGPQPPENFAYPILKSYLRYTFIRLQHERKVITSANQQHRAFNTGLLDRLLRPIYALLSPHPTATQSWELIFCIPGEGFTGKALVANFTDLPAAANYLSNPSKIFYHLSAGTPDVDWHHIVKDNMERLPAVFLAQYAPTNFTYQDTKTLSGNEFHTYKKNFAAALDADPAAYRSIVNRLKEALSRTLLKTQVNYKTAVPTYYPNINSIDLLLPICLVTEDVADCAIVVRQSDSGNYIGHTILTMRQSYNNARLICKLDEHWLSRAMTLSQADFEDDDDDSEEFEADDDVDVASNLSA